MIAVGLSSSILGCLVTLLVYTYCQRYQQQSHDATVIHPISAAPLNTSITNHINKLDKYDSVEAIKVGLIHSYYQQCYSYGKWMMDLICGLCANVCLVSKSIHTFIHCFLISAVLIQFVYSVFVWDCLRNQYTAHVSTFRRMLLLLVSYFNPEKWTFLLNVVFFIT